jgi:hypothetical protein
MAPQTSKPRQRVAKGRRPFFMNNPESDQLLAMVTALVGEVSVLKDRLDTHEQLARAGKVATPDEIEAFTPDEATEEAREASRVAMLQRVFRIISATQDANTEAEDHDVLVEKFANDDKI